MEIGDDPRKITIEPLEDPVPREQPTEVPGSPDREEEPVGV